MKLNEQSKAILKERGELWGSFDDFVNNSSKIKDSFRIIYKDLKDMDKLEFFRLRDFAYEMLTLKLTHAAFVAKQLGTIDLADSRLEECYCDFVNYCTLCASKFKFELRFERIKEDSDFGAFFEAALKNFVFGEGDSNEASNA